MIQNVGFYIIFSRNLNLITCAVIETFKTTEHNFPNTEVFTFNQNSNVISHDILSAIFHPSPNVQKLQIG